jgi:hypothetical protein
MYDVIGWLFLGLMCVFFYDCYKEKDNENWR